MKKLHVSAGSGHHQVLSFSSHKIILYNSIQVTHRPSTETTPEMKETTCN